MAFEELFRMAYRAAAPLVGNGAPAEDVASEACTRAFVHWSKVRGSKAGPWVIRVATNLAIDEVRRRVRRRDLARAEEVVDVGEGLVTRLALAEALRRLSKRQREVVALRYLGGFSEREAAEAMGVSVGSAKRYASRAMEQLRRELGSGHRPPPEVDRAR